jgi:nicotinamide phosphoribosyltransferase
MENNIITLTDSYKLFHHNMLPMGTIGLYSYFEARSGATYNKTVWWSLQSILMKHLVGQVVTKEKIEHARALMIGHTGSDDNFNADMWYHILENHGGKLPLRIKAVDEGTPVDINNVLMTVENLDDKCSALTNYVESLLTHVWSGSTTASLSYEIFKLIKHYNEATSDDPSGLKYALHDFGFRGVSSVESAGRQGSGHALTFMGSDTISALEFLYDYYDSGFIDVLHGIPATEHSIMTAMGPLGEIVVFKNLLQKYPTGLLACVIDSYDYRKFISEYALELKYIILARDGKLIFRPDSGDPDSVTIDCLNRLGEVFGYTVNSKGFKVLNPKVGLIWGDGIDYNGIRSILYTMRNQGWSSDNIAFGCGGGLLQKVNRDTQRFAFKCSAQFRAGDWIDIYKSPLDASKASKRGRLKLIQNKMTGKYSTVGEDEAGEDCMHVVYENGEMKRLITFQQARMNTGNW